MSFLKFWKRDDRREFEGAHARVEAQAALEQAKAQRPAVQVVSRSLKRSYEANGYAELVASLIRGGPR